MNRATGRLMVLAGVVLALRTPLSPALADGSQAGITPLDPNASAFGLTLGEWSAAYHQWELSIPKAVHPSQEGHPEFMGVGERKPVWFLASTGAGTHTYTYTIPTGCSILLTPDSSIEADPTNTKSEANLLKDVSDGLEAPNSHTVVLEASVDGVSIPDVGSYRAQSGLFTVILPPNNLFSLPVKAGTTQPARAASDGYWLLLPPLPPGQHTIHNLTKYSDGWTNDTTYLITVRDP